MFCVSGIVLNHPKLFSSLDVSRKALPRNYEYRQWNGGLLRGTVAWHQKVLLYGYNGVWKTDSLGHKISDFNQGMPIGVDRRSIRRIVVMPQGTLFAAGSYDLFRYRPHRGWTVIPLPIDIDERLSDIANQRDTLLITGRSHIFYSLPPYRTFHRLTLPASPDNDGHVSLFRTVWWLHSGELFGLTGKLIVDGIALVLIFLSLTGIMYWIVPRMTRLDEMAIRLAQQSGTPDHCPHPISLFYRVAIAPTSNAGNYHRTRTCRSFQRDGQPERVVRQVALAAVRYPIR